MTDDTFQSISQSLLKWYDANRRDLPWRDLEDPYGIWISEIMLQQTQVATVRAYWERWMARFPSVEDVAQADLDEVLEVWAGLGYYRRARLLREAAAEIVATHEGELPSSFEALRGLPGIGEYTAGAIASIAFGEAVSAVDGNVIRVVSRLFTIEGPASRAATRKEIRRHAEALLDPQRPGDLNQALMELGATVCTPQNPACDVCPVCELCKGRAGGDPTRFPQPVKRKPPREVQVKTAIVWRDAQRPHYLVVRRPVDGLLGGLWEFPSVDAGDAPIAQYLRDELGVEVGPPVPLGEVVHLFSHLRMTLVVDTREAENAGEARVEARWVDREELSGMALSTAMRKVEALLA